MNKIKILDQNTIDRIAAGEVVERPASVAKELIENAFDSGATAVTVEISGGGIDMIRVTDNGSGIDPSDVRTAFLRHATSKLTSSEDLFLLHTLGFRGEALSSIGAVSRIELITRTKDSLTAVRYIYEGGKEINFEEIGAPVGTTIIMRNLFFNTPARAKFLKTPRSEGGEIASLVEHLALSHPDISLEFINNSDSRLFTSGSGSLKETIFSIYGRELSALMNEVSYQDDILSLTGFAGKPEAGRSSRNYEMVFVNGRFVKDKIISSAAEEAYKGYLMQHRFPFMILNIGIDTLKVDVNVHPSKMALKFSDEQAVYESVRAGIRASLEAGRRVPFVEIRSPETGRSSGAGKLSGDVSNASSRISGSPASDSAPVQEDLQLTRDTASAFATVSEAPKPTPDTVNEERIPGTDLAVDEIFPEPETQVSEPRGYDREQKDSGNSKSDQQTRFNGNDSVKAEPFEKHRREQAKTAFKEHQQTLAELFPETVGEEPGEYLASMKRNIRIIGQLFDTYILAEEGEDFYIIDQHAAHEKVMYETFMRSVEKNELFSQQLMPAVIVRLSASQQSVLKGRKSLLESLGFEIEEFGGNEFRITAVPFHFYGADPKELFTDILDNEPLTGRDTGTIVRDRIIMRSCKAAVKANMKLSEKEIRVLIDDLFSLEDPYRCPHGRPAIVRMSRYEMDKKFKRIV